MLLTYTEKLRTSCPIVTGPDDEVREVAVVPATSSFCNLRSIWFGINIGIVIYSNWRGKNEGRNTKICCTNKSTKA
jgi:hypothetical protein